MATSSNNVSTSTEDTFIRIDLSRYRSKEFKVQSFFNPHGILHQFASLFASPYSFSYHSITLQLLNDGLICYESLATNFVGHSVGY